MAIQEITSKRMNGLQVRVGQGPGQTKFLAYLKHGGKEATMQLALKEEKKLEAIWGKKTKAVTGRMMKNNKSGIPGMRFQWRDYSDRAAYLYLTGNYKDSAGKSHNFAYSCDLHGFDEVMRKALEIREKHGAPKLTLKQAKALIWKHYQEVGAGLK